MNFQPPSDQLPPLTADLLARFAAIVGEKYALTDPSQQQGYLIEERGLYAARTPLVLRPGSVAEVSEILKLANATKTAIVPQGGNTGLVGGQTPHRGEVVLSLNRLDGVREVDPVSNTMTCEAGVTLQKAREAAAKADRLYPQLLASEGTCTIGGNISTNAGGVTALVHGVARQHVMGLEVVLADGRVLHDLNKLKKDNTGYDLRNLFIGAEGTLGVITAAVLRIIPRPRSTETAFAAVSSPQAALELLTVAQERAGASVTSFEIMMRRHIDYVLKHASRARDPIPGSHPWYVLIELQSQSDGGLRDTMEDILSTAMERGVVQDAVIAENLEQAQSFWFVRESFSSVQKLIGAQVKHDISVPVAAVPQFLAEADAAVERLVPGCEPLSFGHLGDGNIHYNVNQPKGADPKAFLARWDEMNAVVFDVVRKLGGSISAEHGVGVMKRDLLPSVKDPVAYALMRTIKQALDPNGILNPGKVL